MVFLTLYTEIYNCLDAKEKVIYEGKDAQTVTVPTQRKADTPILSKNPKEKSRHATKVVKFGRKLLQAANLNSNLG